MITELFYPKELKDIIRKLEAEDNLRREPLEKLDKLLLYFAIFSLFLVISAYSQDGFFWGSLMLLLCCVVIWLVVNQTIKVFKAYIYGSIHRGIITKINYHYYQSISIQCSGLSDEAKVWLLRIAKVPTTADEIKVGNEISYFYAREYNTHKVPNLTNINRYNCLRKDLMKEESDV